MPYHIRDLPSLRPHWSREKGRGLGYLGGIALPCYAIMCRICVPVIWSGQIFFYMIVPNFYFLKLDHSLFFFNIKRLALYANHIHLPILQRYFREPYFVWTLVLDIFNTCHKLYLMFISVVDPHNTVQRIIEKVQSQHWTGLRKMLFWDLTPLDDISNNKYAIYAYTHGPVTGSGPSVVWP